MRSASTSESTPLPFQVKLAKKVALRKTRPSIDSFGQVLSPVLSARLLLRSGHWRLTSSRPTSHGTLAQPFNQKCLLRGAFNSREQL